MCWAVTNVLSDNESKSDDNVDDNIYPKDVNWDAVDSFGAKVLHIVPLRIVRCGICARNITTTFHPIIS